MTRDQPYRFQLSTPEVPEHIRSISLPGYQNIFALQGDNRYRMPDPQHPNLWGTETLCGDWSGSLLILLQDFGTTGWHENQTVHGVPFYSHTPTSRTNLNLASFLNEAGVRLSPDGAGNTTCGAVYASACFLLKDGSNLSGSISKGALAASWPALVFTIANMPNLTDIALGGTAAYETFAMHGDVKISRKEALANEQPIIWRNGIRIHATCHVGDLGLNSRRTASGLKGRAAAGEDWVRILKHARLGNYAKA